MRLGGFGLVFLYQLLLARLMGARGFGEYTVIFTWINFLLVGCLFGFDASVFKLFPSFTEQQQWNKLKGFLTFSKRTILVVSILSSFALLFLLLKNSGRYGVSFSEALFWALLLLPLLAFIYYYSAVLRAFRKYKVALLFVKIILPVLISIACFIYYELNNQTLKVDAAMFIYLCSALVVLLFISGRVKKQFSSSLVDCTNEFERKVWLKASIPVFVISAVSLLIKSGDILFISYYFGNTRAGIYAVATLIASFVPFVVSVPESFYLPRIHELRESRQHEKLQQTIRKSTKAILVIALPMVFIIIGFGKFFLQIFGTAFIASYLPLVILTAGHIANIRIGMVAGIQKTSGNQKKFLAAHILAGILNIALNFIFVPLLGMIGAAISSVLSLTALNLLVYFFGKKKFKVPVAAVIF